MNIALSMINFLGSKGVVFIASLVLIGSVMPVAGCGGPAVQDNAKSAVAPPNAVAAAPSQKTVAPNGGGKIGGGPKLTTYTLPGEGFSVGYPKHWKPMTPNEVRRATHGLMEVSPHCVLFLANPSDYDQNVNIQITSVPGQADFTDSYVTDQFGAVIDGLKQGMPGAQEVKHSVGRVAGSTAMDLTIRTPRSGAMIRQRLVLFVKSERLFTITCTAPDAKFDSVQASALEPIIDSIAVSK